MAVIAINAAFLSFPYDYSIALVYGLGLLVIYWGIACFNLYVLIPRYLLRNCYWVYMGILTAFVLLFIAIDLWIELYISTHFHLDFGRFSILERRNTFLLNIAATCFLYLICFAGTSIGVLFKHWLASRQQLNGLEKATIQTELQHLKSQIHPSFLFDTLEKAGLFATQAPGKTSGILIKLSRFLRYQLYDSARNEVMLSSEIASLQNLLNLETELRNGFTYSITTDGDTKQIVIPPLLFISVVLHSIDTIKEDEKAPFIHLSFRAEEKGLVFTCSVTASEEFTGLEYLSGIKRRLDLLYGENYTLNFTEEVSKTIYLQLNLQ
jgi:LytS/YehU family sensor histidine kinase